MASSAAPADAGGGSSESSSPTPGTGASQEPRAGAASAIRAGPRGAETAPLLDPKSATPPVRLSFQERFFPWRPLPWWLMLILIVAFFSDFKWRYHESPCSVLGLSDPFTMSAIKRSFRTISLCTHPDRLRSTLKRPPTEAEQRMGQTLFNRHTDARDKLVRFIEIKEKRRQLRWERINKKRKKQGLKPLPKPEEREDLLLEIGENSDAEDGDVGTKLAADESAPRYGNAAEPVSHPSRLTKLFTSVKTSVKSYFGGLTSPAGAYSSNLDPTHPNHPVNVPVESARCADLDATNWSELWQLLQTPEAVSEIWQAFTAFMYQLVTFEAGFLTTVALSFWLFFLYRMLRELVNWGLSAGSALPLYVIGGVLSRPIPTLTRFLALPFLRAFVFLEELRGGESGGENAKDIRDISDSPVKKEKAERAAESGADGGKDSASSSSTKMSSRHIAAAVDTSITGGGVRKRKGKKVSGEVEAVQEVPLLNEVEEAPDSSGVDSSNPSEPAQPPGTASAAQPPGARPQMQPNALGSGPPSRFGLSTLEILRLRSDTPNKARMDVATLTQFDILLPLTKPIIPLLMLICTGQVWNGIVSSIVISQFLRSCVPQMNYETHHLLCLLFGFWHTLLGVGADQVEAHADKENAVLLLQWEWGFKDMVSILNMIMLGAFVASLSRNGNEPQFCNSFASGLGLRLLFTMDWVQELPFGLAELFERAWTQTQADLHLKFQSVDALLTNVRKDVGDCGGGVYRSLTSGDETAARLLSVGVKLFLIVLPLLSSLQWLLRAWTGFRPLVVGGGAGGGPGQGGAAVVAPPTNAAASIPTIARHPRQIRTKKRLLRVVTRFVLGLAGLVQCGLLLYFNLNAANGGLLNLWLAFLIGSLFESYLACEDIRGSFRQFVTAVVFIFI